MRTKVPLLTLLLFIILLGGGCVSSPENSGVSPTSGHFPRENTSASTTNGVGITVLGPEPNETTEGWVYAKNSTRSYALLVKPLPSGMLAFLWLFNPGGSIKSATFRLMGNGKTLAVKNVSLFRKGAYEEVLVGVSVPGLGFYTLEARIGDLTLRVGFPLIRWATPSTPSPSTSTVSWRRRMETSSSRRSASKLPWL